MCVVLATNDRSREREIEIPKNMFKYIYKYMHAWYIYIYILLQAIYREASFFENSSKYIYIFKFTYAKCTLVHIFIDDPLDAQLLAIQFESHECSYMIGHMQVFLRTFKIKYNFIDANRNYYCTHQRTLTLAQVCLPPSID